LAADIVMPESIVEKEVKRRFGGIVTEATIDGLASHFEVSKAAMEIRLSAFVGQ
jgi:Zn-dependent peptidase ImmA (M78 family)